MVNKTKAMRSMLDGIPDLPFNKLHRFIASLGALLVLLSLFVETAYLTNELVFELGFAALSIGLASWLVEMSLTE